MPRGAVLRVARALGFLALGTMVMGAEGRTDDCEPWRPTFTMDPVSPIVGQPVTFTADGSLINDPPTPLWDLGDTEHRAGNPLVYSYAGTGTYRVILTANERNCSTTQLTEQYITVRPRPYCDFSDLPPWMHFCCGNETCDGGEDEQSCPQDCGSLQVSAGGLYTGRRDQAIDFTSSVVTRPGEYVTGYRWEFGDGASATGESASHTYTAGGDFHVVLRVTSNFTTQTALTRATIDPCNRDARCDSGEPPSCQDCDGLPHCGNGVPNPGETCATCPGDVGWRPTFSIQPPEVYVGQPVTLTAEPSLINDPPPPLWDLGNTDHRSGNPFDYAYAAEGTYTITLTASEGRCGATRTAQGTVVVHSSPLTCDIYLEECPLDLGGPYEAAIGQPITFRAEVDLAYQEHVLGYLWLFGHTRTSTQVSPVETFSTPGTFTVTLHVYTNQRTQTNRTDVTILPCHNNQSCEVGEGDQCPDCLAQPLCGNGQVDPGETCANCERDTAGRPSFVVMPPSPRMGWPTTFAVPSDQIDEAVTPVWDFENGDTREGNPVLYTFPTWGDFAVTLTAHERNCGARQETRSVVHVHGPLHCDFSDLPPHLQVCCGNQMCDAGENEQDCAQDCANPLTVDVGSPYEGFVGVPLQFSATVTTPPGQTIQSRLWFFGDGGTSAQASPTHLYRAPGVYPVGLFVTTGALHALGGTTATIVEDASRRDDAEFVGHSIPPELIAGESLDVWVKVRNIGTTDWTPGDAITSGYALSVLPGLFMPQGAHVPLPTPDEPGGRTYTFRFTIPPPDVPPPDGVGTLSARMVRNGLGHFGPELTRSIAIVDGRPADTTLRLEPTSGSPGTLVMVRRTSGQAFAPGAVGRFSFGDPGGAPYSRVGVSVTFHDPNILSFVVPGGADCGEHYFAVPANRSNSAMFTVTGPCNPRRRNTVKVFSYNIQFLPDEACDLAGDGNNCSKEERLPLLINHPDLQPHDVLVLSEAFSDSHTNRLRLGLRGQYPYYSGKLGRDEAFCPGPIGIVCQDGGVAILSKWPIEAVDSFIYTVCSGAADCHAQKGVLYARINKGGQRYHIFGTHLDADVGSERDAGVRDFQLRQMAFFVYSTANRARSDEPLIMAGDFNVDRLSFEYQAMLGHLRALQPPREGGDVTTPASVGGPGKWIDYVLISTDYLLAPESRNLVVKPRHPSGPYPEGNLSDHYAVLGTFVFELPQDLPPRALAPPAATPVPLGPLTDTDNPMPAFSWSEAADADVYSLWVTDADGTLLMSSPPLAGTSFRPGVPLPSDADLRWRVQARNAAGPGPEPAAVYFRVERGGSSPPTAAPVPAVPGGAIQTPRPTFVWSAVPGATSYGLRVFTSGDTVVLDQTRIFGTAQAAMGDLPTGQELFWTVRAESPFGPGPASPAIRFEIADSGGNKRPGVTIVGPDACAVPCDLELAGLAFDPDGDPLTYRWVGCAPTDGTRVTCSLSSPGQLLAAVTVDDGHGGIASAVKLLTAQPGRLLSVIATGPGRVTSSPGSIVCPGPRCSEAFTPGTQVVLTASPEPDTVFAGWSGGSCAGAALTCAVTLDGGKTVVATFLPLYTLTLNISGAGGGTVTSAPAGIDCGTAGGCANEPARFVSGTLVTLRMQADPGSAFVEWGGACQGTQSSCNVMMNGPRTISATFAPPAASQGFQYYPLPQPCRLLDTRTSSNGGGAPLLTGVPRTVQISGTCVSASASAVALVVTAVNPTGVGHLRMNSSALTTASVASFPVAGGAWASSAVTALSNSGQVTVEAGLMPGGSTHLVIDATGFFMAPGIKGQEFTPAPTSWRLADTTLAAGEAKIFQGNNQTPAAAAFAVSVAAVNPSAAGHLTLYPANTGPGGTSTLNYAAGSRLYNGTIVGTSTTGTFAALSSRDQSRFIVDVNGTFHTPTTNSLRYHPISPCRVLDTRLGGAALSGGTSRWFQVRRMCGSVPDSAQAVTANFSVVRSQAPGHLAFHTNGAIAPPAAHLLYQPGWSVGSGALLPLTSISTAEGDLAAYSVAGTELVVDVTGYFSREP